jgi:hypothetical protein
MNPSIQSKTTVPNNLIRHLPLVRTFLLIALVLVCFAVSPTARAVLPAPDGGYPNANTAEGDNALFSLTSGFGNTANGADALFGNTSGSRNTAVGTEALFSNSAGGDNTATGVSALHNNTTGNNNTADGLFALYSNTTSHDNTAVGSQALTNNTGFVTGAGGGSFNTAIGSQAVFSNTTGFDNTAVGFQALYSNTIGSDNTAIGDHALYNNTALPFFVPLVGHDNTAIGSQALYTNQIGVFNTATGAGALYSGVLGGFPNSSWNTANGADALHNLTFGFTNIALGYQAGFNLTTGDNNIDIGNKGVAGESDTIRIGTHGTQKATFIAGIIGVPIAGPTVHISGTGQLGIGPPSSERFKDQIKPMDKASEAILALKPVTFRYKKELDPEGIPQFGLVAEDVEKVNPDLVARDAEGKVYTVRYEVVNAMLLNEFLKEHRTVQELKSTVAKQEAKMARQQKDFQVSTTQQEKEIRDLAASLKEQASQIQKVSAQLEVSKAKPQTIANNQ